jgi:hypothetical protein
MYYTRNKIRQQENCIFIYRKGEELDTSYFMAQYKSNYCYDMPDVNSNVRGTIHIEVVNVSNDW